MDIFKQIRFYRINNIWMFAILIVVLILFYMAYIRRKKFLRLLGNIDIINKMILNLSPGKRVLKKIFLFFGLLFIIIALLRPQFGTKMEMVKRKGIDIIVAIDVSRSMLVEDLPPNRLAFAKSKVLKFLDRLKGDRIGLIAFAGKAFLQCPLTLDYAAVKIFMEDISPESISYKGTNIAESIKKALEAFEKSENKQKVLIIITDGEDQGKDVIQTAEKAGKNNIVIYTIGIGTPSGEPIPIRDKNGNIEGYHKDKDGNTVVSRLDEETLQKIALETDGKYYPASTSDIELDKIYQDINKLEKAELMSKKFTTFEERYQVFLFLALLFLGIEAILTDKK